MNLTKVSRLVKSKLQMIIDRMITKNKRIKLIEDIIKKLNKFKEKVIKL